MPPLLIKITFLCLPSVSVAANNGIYSSFLGQSHLVINLQDITSTTLFVAYGNHSIHSRKIMLMAGAPSLLLHLLELESWPVNMHC